MTNELEVTEQQQSRPTRRAVVATGVKLAYVAPILAASFKLSASNAFAIAAISGGFCGHSTGPNGGCMGACTSKFTGAECGPICVTGQSTGACPVGQGGDNPCCNAGYCDPANFTKTNTQQVVYIGSTTGCPTTLSVTTTKTNKTKKNSKK